VDIRSVFTDGICIFRVGLSFIFFIRISAFRCRTFFVPGLYLSQRRTEQELVSLLDVQQYVAQLRIL